MILQLQRLFGSITTYYTIGYHAFSSALIVGLYMITSTEGMDLGIVTEGRYTPPLFILYP